MDFFLYEKKVGKEEECAIVLQQINLEEWFVWGNFSPYYATQKFWYRKSQGYNWGPSLPTTLPFLLSINFPSYSFGNRKTGLAFEQRGWVINFGRTLMEDSDKELMWSVGVLLCLSTAPRDICYSWWREAHMEHVIYKRRVIHTCRRLGEKR